MKFADLFCGLGGTTYGAISVGLEPLLLVDNNPEVKGTLPEVLSEKFQLQDLSTIGAELFDQICEAEALFCSPPCQSYSQLKTRNNNFNVRESDIAFSDSIVDLIQNGAFKVILIENVPSFLKSNEANRIIECMLKTDLQICAGVFDAASFGVPQRRKRSIILGSKNLKEVRLSCSPVTVRDAFNALPKLNSEDLLHYNNKKHTKKVIDRIQNIPKDGGSRSSLPDRLVLDCHKKTNGFRDIYGRMSWDKQAPTITSGCTNPSKGRFLHPEENRAITLREAARLQTLPDSLDLKSIKSLGKKAQLIGNAFPSKMVAELLNQTL